MERNSFKCAVVGEWHLAFVTACGLLELGHSTLLVKPSEKDAWTKFPVLDLDEPHVNEKLAIYSKEGLAGFHSGIDSNWSADLVWVAIDTPVDDDDNVDLRPVDEVLESIKEHHNAVEGVVITSQIPLDYCRKKEDELGLKIAYVPENLRLGYGLETFLKADRLVIGSDDDGLREKVDTLLSGIDAQRMLCDVATSEMIKHATNSFLATSISLSNQLAKIGELYGVDNQKVGKALKMDSRIGKKAYVLPGRGFAGGTLPRDLKVLQSLGKKKSVTTKLVDAVLDINDDTNNSILSSLSAELKGLEGKKILIMGYSYKPEIDTFRRSGSLELARLIASHKGIVMGFDPVMNEKDLSPLEGLIRHKPDWKDLGEELDAVVVMTPRKHFASLDWSVPGKRPGAIVLDADSKQDSSRIVDSGFKYKALWQPTLEGVKNSA